LETKLQLLESISTIDLEKTCSMKDFLNQFSVSNKDLTKVKQLTPQLISKSEYLSFSKKLI